MKNEKQYNDNSDSKMPNIDGGQNMYYFILAITLVLLIALRKSFYYRVQLIVICAVMLVLSLLLTLVVLDGGGYSSEGKIVSTEKYALLNYQECTRITNGGMEENIICYQTVEGSFEIHSDSTTEIVKTEKTTPKYVTVTENQCFNYLTLFSGICTVYIFTVN